MAGAARVLETAGGAARLDFPVLSVAAAARIAADGTVESARIVLGAVASQPLTIPAAAAALIGQRLTDTISLAADAALDPPVRWTTRTPRCTGANG